jgi:beta-barrel assembly-enhancing protease
VNLSRRRALAWGCVHCAGAAGLATAHAAPIPPDWALPPRLTRPEIDGDEGGLWALVDREETRTRRSAFVLRDPALRAYLTGIACKLGGDHCADTRVYAVRTPYFNASMAPNGMMQVWTGLLLRADNEAQLAAVMGHEIGHYLQRHSLARLRDAKSRTAAMGVLAFAGGVGLIGQLALLAGMASYSREHETEADQIGLLLMRRAGYETRAAAQVWTNLRDELKAGAGGDPAKRSVMFATHPGADERERDLQTLAGAGGGFTGDAEYAERLEPLMPDLIDDELRRAQYDESIVLFSRLAQRRPSRGDLRYARGEAHRLRAQPADADQAMAEFQAALALERPPPQTHRALGLLHRAQGRRAEARPHLQAYLQQAPNAADAALIQSFLDEPAS